MRKLLLTATALLALTTASSAAVIEDLGINPTSIQGAFSNSVGGGAFSDQYTFQLVGGPLFLTIGSVTNVFPNSTDFITNFTASLFEQVGAVGGGDDILVLGPVFGSPCVVTPSCQFVAGAAFLDPGSYYAQIAGVGGGTSGYGGNLATFAVPGPVVGAGIPGVVAACFGLYGLHRRRRTVVS